jgi:deoxyribose-phosphate aldolase
MVDASLVGPWTCDEEVHQLARLTNANRFKAIIVPFRFLDIVKETLLEGHNLTTIIAGGAGFPTGAESTAIKAAQLMEAMAVGAREYDIVNNLSLVKSGRFAEIEEELKLLIDLVQGAPTKVIIEATYLSDDEIRRMCEIVARVGAAFIKTGTGWAKSTTLEQVKLIKSCVGDSLQIKAAGGVRDLASANAMLECGVTRFGIGMSGLQAILSEFDQPA